MGKYAITSLEGAGFSGTGFRVSGIGDINGDGFEDVAITAAREYSSGYDNYGNYTQTAGRVYVVFGSEEPPLSRDLTALDGTDGFVIEADPLVAGFYGNYGNVFGSSITALGDVNGDGIDDFGIAQNARYTQYGSYYGGSEYDSGYYYHTTRTEGVAYVIYGGQFDDTDAVHDVTDFEHFRIDTAGEITGLIGLGDVNGDGFDDVGMNARQRSPYDSQYVDNLYFYDANDNGIYDPDEVTNPDEFGYYNTRYVSVDAVTGYVIFGTDQTRVSDGGEGGSDVTIDGDGLDGSDGFRVSGGTFVARDEGLYYYEGGPVGVARVSAGVGVGGYGYYGQNRYEAGIVGAADVDGDGFADVVVKRGATGIEGDIRFRSPGEYGYYNDYSYNDGVFNAATSTEFIDGSGAGSSSFEFADARVSGFFTIESGAVATLGDVSGGDGFEEVAFRDFQNDTSLPALADFGLRFASGVFVFNGAADRLDDQTFGDDDGDLADGTAAFYFSSEVSGTGTSSSFSVSAVLGVGDMTGDGIDDFAIIGRDFANYSGRIVGYIVAGTDEVRSGAIDLEALVAAGEAYKVVGDPNSANDALWIAPAGDVDGDGADDLIVGGSEFFEEERESIIIFGGESLEALDEADGIDDNVAFTENGEVDVETGLLPIRISISDDIFRDEGTKRLDDASVGITEFIYTVFRSGDLTAAVTVDYEVVPGGFSNFVTDADADDFDGGVLPTGTVTFAAGSATATISIPVAADNIQEPAEDFSVVLSNATTDNTAPVFIERGSAVGYIFNDDFPSQYGVRDASVLEGDSGTTDVTITFTRSGNTNVNGTVDYTIQPWLVNPANSDDIVGTLPLTGTVSFAAGVTQQSITLQVQGDTAIEANELLQVVLSNETAVDANGVSADAAIIDGNGFVTILNDDGPVRFQAFAGTATEGAAGNLTPLTFTVTRSGDTDVAASVNYAFTALGASAADFENGALPAGGTLQFAADETSKTVVVNVADDALFENTEYLRMTLSSAATPGANGAVIDRAVATGTIFDDEVPVYYRVGNGSVVEAEEGETSQMRVTVTRTGDISAGGSVDYTVNPYPFGSAASQADFVDTLPITGTVNFAAGQTSQSFTIDIAGDDIVEGTEYFEIRISNATSTDPSALPQITDAFGLGTILDDDIPVYFRASGGQVVEGDVAADNRELTFTVTRFGETGVQASVRYDIAGGTADASDFESSFPTSGTLIFAAGETSKTVTMRISEDLEVEPDEVTYITLSNASSTDPNINAIISGGIAAGTIKTDDFPAIISTNFSSTVTEGDTPADNRALVFTVTRSGDLDATVTMDWSFEADFFNGLSANDLEGGLPQGGSLTFGTGVQTQVVRLPIAEDFEVEANERGTFRITNVTSPDGGTVRVDRSISYATVVNDDAPPEIRLTVNGNLFAAAVIEGPEGALQIVPFEFERTGDINDRVTITFDLLSNLATGRGASSFDLNGTQIPQTDLTVTIQPGQSSATFNVPVSGDFLIEADESLFVRITEVQSQQGISYSLPSSSAFLTIINDDGRPPTPDLPVDTDGDGIPDTTIPIEADIFGDPHITTLDGLGYDFQAVGEYILVETQDGVTNPFSVQIRFEAFPGSDLVSVATRMAVELNGHVIEVDAFDPASPLLIDGNPPTAEELAAGAIDLDGDPSNGADIFIEDGKIFVVLNEANEQLMIGVLEDALNVCVFLGDPAQGGNAGQVRGLMGNANQDLSDDFALRDGAAIPDGEIAFDDDLVPSLSFDFLYGRGDFEGGGYRASWSVTEAERAFTDTAPDFPENFPAGPLTVDALPEDIRAAAEEQAIAAGLPGPGQDGHNQTIFNAAVLDFALTGMGAFLTGATQLAAEPEAETEAADAPELNATIGVTAKEASVVEGDDGDLTTLTFTFYRLGDASGTLEVAYAIQGDVDADDLAPGTPLTGTVGFEDGQGEVTLDIVVRGDLATEDDEALSVVITGTDVEGVLVGGAQGETVIETDDFGPEARDDEFTGDNGTIGGNLFDDNNAGADSDADDDTLTVTRVFADGETFEVGADPITLPSGVVLTIDPATGAFTADTSAAFPTLAAGKLGLATFDYEISDGNGGTDIATVTLNVRGVAVPNADPEAVDDQVTTNEDTAVPLSGLTGNDRDDDGDEVSLTGAFSDPQDGQIVFQDGEYRYVPNQDFFGTDTFTYEITDGNGGFDTGTVEILVNPVNDAPEAEDDAAETDFQTAIVIDVLGNDNDVDDAAADLTVTEVFTDENTFGTVDIGADGTLTYTPEDGFAGVATFGYEVSDGDLTDTATVRVTVDGPGARTITVDSLSIVEGDDGPSTGTLVLRRTGDLRVSETVSGTTRSGTATEFVDFTGIDFSARFEPNVGLALINLNVLGDNDIEGFERFFLDFSVDSAFDNVTVIADAAPASSAFDFTAPVGIIDDDFAIEIDSPSALESDGSITFTITRRGDLSEASFGVQLVEGTATSPEDFQGEGQFLPIQFAQDQTQTSLTVGLVDDDVAEEDESFVLRLLDDAGVVAQGTATILNDDVPNRRPIANDDVVELFEDTPFAGSVAGNDSDPDGDSLTFSLVTGVSKGELDFEADGSLRYTPDPDYFGPDSFTYQADDGNGGTDTATVTLNVIPVNDAPEIAPIAVSVTEDEAPLAVDLLLGAGDAEGDPLVVAGAVLAASDGRDLSGIATLSGATLDLDPGGFGGLGTGDTVTVTVTYAVSDGLAETPNTATITIAGRNDGPEANDDGPFAATEGAVTGPLDVLANDSDAEDDDLTIVGSDAGTKLGGTVVVAADGKSLSVDYTDVDLPDLLEGETREDSFQYVISDGSDLVDAATVTLTLAGQAEDDPEPELVPVIGTAGRDLMRGTDADEFINGLGGSDTHYGGGGADTFAFFSDGVVDRESIRDFEAGIDSILLDSEYMVRFTSRYALISTDEDQIIVYGNATTEADLGISMVDDIVLI